MRVTSLSCIAMLFACATAFAQPTPSSSTTSAASRVFWSALDKIGVVVKSMGSLSSGVERGVVWMVDLQTGQRHRIGQSNDLAWPVMGPNGGSVLALRGRQIVKLDSTGNNEEPIRAKGGDWRKLLGVAPDGTIIGFLSGNPRAQPALILPDGTVEVFPQPATDQEKRDSALLLQEKREDKQGRVLETRRSERSGRGFDVFLVSGHAVRNLSDCGDDACGQPSFSPHGESVLYVRAPR